jgi:hypothetical protein
MTQLIHLNGINGSTGQPLQNIEITTELIARIARRERLSQDDLRDIKLRHAHNLRSKHQMGVAEGIDITDLAETGWGIIFPSNLDAALTAAIKDALQPLLELRREQAGRYFFEFSGPERGYQPGESKNGFLKRFGRGPGPANPALGDGVPFYLLIVGSPEEIPFEFQYALDVQYGVGRIHFDQLEDYAIYAESVVRAEKGQSERDKKVTFFGPSHDRVTEWSSSLLVSPLAEQITTIHPDWNVRALSGGESTKATLGTVLGGDATPSLLFTASHGMGWDMGDPRQIPHTGALVTQDVSNYAGGIFTDRYYFSADDLPANANVSGMIAFFFACFGAGTPRLDNFVRDASGSEHVIAPYSFLSKLPLKMLAHPQGGALGVFAHVDRAWAYSFLWDDDLVLAIAEVETFRSLVSALLNGKPAGSASDYFGARYGEISTMLNEELNTTTSEHQDAARIAWLWTTNLDARNYAFIGDPAVRLKLSG